MYKKALITIVGYTISALLTYVLASNIIFFDNVGQPVLFVMVAGFILTILLEVVTEHMEDCDRVRKREKESRTS